MNIIMASTCTILLSFILAGCASTKSIVVSNRSSVDSIAEGILYSLPKQLVKVSYTRKAIDSSKAAKAKKDAQDAVDKAEADIKEKKQAANDIEALIKNIDPQASNRIEVETKLNLELTKAKAEILILTTALSEKKSKLLIVAMEYAQSLNSDKAFSEELAISPDSPTADNNNTFYAKVNHSKTYSDTLEIKIKNGLLDGAVGYSEDKTGEIIASLAGSLSGLIQPSFLGLAQPKMFSSHLPPIQGACKKEDAISISQTIDPSEPSDLTALNQRLKSACIYLAVEEPNTTKTATLKSLNVANGLVYRQPGVFTFIVKNIDDQSELQKVRLSLAQGGQIGIISMPKGAFSKNDYDVTFSNGMLTKNKVILPSEVLGAVMVLPNSLRAALAIPTELIQFKVDYNSSQKELLELKKAMLQAQIEINKKQLELDTLDADAPVN